MHVILLPDPQATEAFGAMLADRVRPGDVVTLEGTLGAGKTSVARGLLAALGLAGEAPSPSFAIELSVCICGATSTSHSGSIGNTERIYGLVVSTNSAKTTHLGRFSIKLLDGWIKTVIPLLLSVR